MQKRQPLLFVVEDDPAMRQLLSDYLSQHQMDVVAMASAEEFMTRIHRARPDLAIMDISLPGQTGLQGCQTLRAQGDRMPIILLTARTEEIDRILGLEMGADDYLGKPFSARELVARIRTVLRRAATVPGLPVAGSADVQMGEVLFQLGSRRLLHPARGAQALSTVEYAMLAELALNPRVPISRERLLAASHTDHASLLPRTVDVAIMRLRKLIETDPARPRYLQTVRGSGYVFLPDDLR